LEISEEGSPKSIVERVRSEEEKYLMECMKNAKCLISNVDETSSCSEDKSYQEHFMNYLVKNIEVGGVETGRGVIILNNLISRLFRKLGEYDETLEKQGLLLFMENLVLSYYCINSGIIIDPLKEMQDKSKDFIKSLIRKSSSSSSPSSFTYSPDADDSFRISSKSFVDFSTVFSLLYNGIPTFLWTYIGSLLRQLSMLPSPFDPCCFIRPLLFFTRTCHSSYTRSRSLCFLLLLFPYFYRNGMKNMKTNLLNFYNIILNVFNVTQRWEDRSGDLKDTLIFSFIKDYKLDFEDKKNNSATEVPLSLFIRDDDDDDHSEYSSLLLAFVTLLIILTDSFMKNISDISSFYVGNVHQKDEYADISSHVVDRGGLDESLTQLYTRMLMLVEAVSFMMLRNEKRGKATTFGKTKLIFIEGNELN
jgi:hypothetical protein